MTPLTTAAAATRVIRSPPGSQLERNRAFWRMISASFMQVSDAHLHRRNRRRSASVTRSSATPPRRASSASSSDTADAGAAADGDYELEERSAGNTPRRRSATGSRAISPAAPRKHTPRKSKSPASPSSSRAMAQALHFSQAVCRAHHWHRLAQGKWHERPPRVGECAHRD